MSDNNGRPVMTDFGGTFIPKQLENVNSFESKDDKKLLNDIRTLLIAGFADLYGDKSEKKYRYIVDLIIDRVKNVIEDLSITTNIDSLQLSCDEIKSLIEENIKKNTSVDYSEKFKLIFDKIDLLLMNFANSQIEYAQYFEDQKTQLKNIFDIVENMQTKEQRKETESKRDDRKNDKRTEKTVNKKKEEKAKLQKKIDNDKKKNEKDDKNKRNENNNAINLKPKNPLSSKVSSIQLRINNNVVKLLNISSVINDNIINIQKSINNNVAKTSNITKTKRSPFVTLLTHAVKNVMTGLFTFFKTMFSVILLPFKLILGGIFGLVKVVFTVISGIINFVKSPVFLLAAAIFGVIMWQKIKEPLLNWYTKNVRPVLDSFLSVFDDNDPAIRDKSFFQKIFIGASRAFMTMWDNLWEDYGGFLGFVKEKLWPTLTTFFSNNWGKILVSLGLGYLINNPFQAIYYALNIGVKAIDLGIRVGTPLARLAPILMSGAAALGPWGWAAIAIGGIAAGLSWWFSAKENEEIRQLQEQNDIYLANYRIEAEKNTKYLDKILKNTNTILKKDPNLLKALNLKSLDEFLPKKIGISGDRFTDLPHLKNAAAEVQSKAQHKVGDINPSWTKDNWTSFESISKFNEIVHNILGFEHNGFTDIKKELFKCYAEINSAIQLASNFGYNYVIDPMNHVGDNTLLAKRYPEFIKILNSIANTATTKLSTLASHAQARLIKKGRDEFGEVDPTWKSTTIQQIAQFCNTIHEQLRNATYQLMLNPNKKDDEKHLKAVNDRSINAMNILRNTAIRIAGSSNIWSELNKTLSQNAIYNSIITNKRSFAVKHASIHMVDKFVKTHKIAQNLMTEDDEFKKNLKERIEAISLMKFMQHGTNVSDQDLFKILDSVYNEYQEESQKSNKPLSERMQSLLQEIKTVLDENRKALEAHETTKGDQQSDAQTPNGSVTMLNVFSSAETGILPMSKYGLYA